MKHITTRPFHIMADCGKVYQFLAGIYERDWKQHTVCPFWRAGGTDARRTADRIPQTVGIPKFAV